MVFLPVHLYHLYRQQGFALPCLLLSPDYSHCHQKYRHSWVTEATELQIVQCIEILQCLLPGTPGHYQAGEFSLLFWISFPPGLPACSKLRLHLPREIWSNITDAFLDCSKFKYFLQCSKAADNIEIQGMLADLCCTLDTASHTVTNSKFLAQKQQVFSTETTCSMPYELCYNDFLSFFLLTDAAYTICQKKQCQK